MYSQVIGMYATHDHSRWQYLGAYIIYVVVRSIEYHVYTCMCYVLDDGHANMCSLWIILSYVQAKTTYNNNNLMIYLPTYVIALNTQLVPIICT